MRGWSLTLGAVPVLARVVGDVLVIALGAGGHMPAERLGPASLDSRHHLELAQADMPCIGMPICGAVSSEDVGNLQPRARQGPRLTLVASCGFAGSTV